MHGRFSDVEALRRCFPLQTEEPDGEGRDAGLVRAAVLVPLVWHAGHVSVLLTQRTDHLHHHPGQISFPGGREEPDDASPEATALRESREEIGLRPEQVEIIGRLPLHRTTTGFVITPVVSVVMPPLALELDTFEVAEAFEVPLDFVLDARNVERHEREFEGRMHSFYAMPYDGHFIWGATAGMLMSLARFLQSP